MLLLILNNSTRRILSHGHCLKCLTWSDNLYGSWNGDGLRCLLVAEWTSGYHSYRWSSFCAFTLTLDIFRNGFYFGWAFWTRQVVEYFPKIKWQVLLKNQQLALLELYCVLAYSLILYKLVMQDKILKIAKKLTSLMLEVGLKLCLDFVISSFWLQSSRWWLNYTRLADSYTSQKSYYWTALKLYYHSKNRTLHLCN